MPDRDVDCSESAVKATYDRAIHAASRGVWTAAILARHGRRHDHAAGREGKARHLAKLARFGGIASRHSRAMSGACDEARRRAVAHEIDRARRAGTSGRVWGPSYFADPGRN